MRPPLASPPRRARRLLPSMTTVCSRSMMWMPLRSLKMYGRIFGFQRFVWCPEVDSRPRALCVSAARLFSGSIALAGRSGAVVTKSTVSLWNSFRACQPALGPPVTQAGGHTTHSQGANLTRTRVAPEVSIAQGACGGRKWQKAEEGTCSSMLEVAESETISALSAYSADRRRCGVRRVGPARWSCGRELRRRVGHRSGQGQRSPRDRAAPQSAANCHSSAEQNARDRASAGSLSVPSPQHPVRIAIEDCTGGITVSRH